MEKIHVFFLSIFSVSPDLKPVIHKKTQNHLLLLQVGIKKRVMFLIM